MAPGWRTKSSIRWRRLLASTRSSATGQATPSAACDHLIMREDEEGPEGFDEDHENFEDTVRSIAHEIRESVERMAADVDVDDLAGYVGVDPDRARDWMETAASWLGAQLEHLGDEFASRTSGAASESGTPGSASE